MLLATVEEEGEALRLKPLFCNYINVLSIEINVLSSFPPFKEKTQEHLL